MQAVKTDLFLDDKGSIFDLNIYMGSWDKILLHSIYTALNRAFLPFLLLSYYNFALIVSAL